MVLDWSHRQLAVFVVLFSVLLALLMQGPQWLHQRHSDATGIPVYLNSDEDIYRARVQEAMHGELSQVSEAFVGHPGLKGTQLALIESAYGVLFGWTGLRAPVLLSIMDSVVPVCIFLSLFYLFLLLGFKKEHAFVAATAFCVLQLYSLGRPIHMRASFLIMLWSMVAVIFADRGKWWGMFVGGALLGLLFGIYFWAFAFAWAFWGCLFLWAFLRWSYLRWVVQKRLQPSLLKRLIHTSKSVLWHFHPRKPEWSNEPWHVLALTGVLGAVCALPFVTYQLQLRLHSLYEYGIFRSGMYSSRLPESFIYSAIFTILVAAIFVAIRRDYATLQKYRTACCIVFAAFVFMHQQIVHGTIFYFVSHGIFSLLLAAMCFVLLAFTVRSRILLSCCFAALLYMAGLAYDGRYVLKQWSVNAEEFSQQHLVDALPSLDGQPRGRILTDPETSAFVAGFTRHNVVYSIYLKNVLMTHAEIASRFCLTQLPLLPSQRSIEDRYHLVYPDSVEKLGGDLREQEVELVLRACEELDLDPAIAMRVYEITHVLWNKKAQPDWNVRRLRTSLEEVASGETWVLYKIVDTK